MSVKSEDGIDFEDPGVGKNPTAANTAGIPVGVIVYTVVIMATDPSGAPGTGPVSVYLSDVNEPPTFGDPGDQTTLYIAENADPNNNITTDDGLQTAAANYSTGAADEDAEDGGDGDGDGLTFTLEGAPAGTFVIVDPSIGAITAVTDFRANFEVRLRTRWSSSPGAGLTIVRCLPGWV